MRTVFREAGQDGQAPKFVMEENASPPELKDNSVIVQVKACGLSMPKSKVLNEIHRSTPRLQYSVGQEVAGVVKEVGRAVTTVVAGDRVAGNLPVDSEYSGCAEFCLFNEYEVVKLPEKISFTDAAGCIGDGVKAYTALQYLAHLCSGDTILLMDGASSWGCLAIQLAHHWGAKVLATSSTAEEKDYLDQLHPSPAQVIELGSKNNILLSSMMEETGGLGVDIFIDNGVRLFTTDEDINIMNERYPYPVPTKHEVISSLAVGARWITSQMDLQLDPPNSELLYLKGASVCYLFEHIWTLSASQVGRYQHIMKDILDKVVQGVLKPNITKTVTLHNVVEAVKELPHHRVGKIVLQCTP